MPDLLRTTAFVCFIINLTCLQVIAHGITEPRIPPPPGVKFVQEFRLQGPLLEKIKQERPALVGIQGVLIRRFELSSKQGRVKERSTRILDYYEHEMGRLGWYPLINRKAGLRHGAAYSSPDGNSLFAVNLDWRMMVTSMVNGQIALSQIPELERVILRKLAPGKDLPDNEDHEALGGIDAALKAGNPQQALTLVTRALQRRPKSVFLRQKLAEVYGKLGRTNDQISELKSVVASDPSGYGIRMAYAIALYDAKKDLNAALFELSQAAALAPDRGAPRYYIARIHEDAERYQAALTAYRQAGELAPYWVSVPLRMGAIYEKLKDFNKAAAAYQRALEIEPSNAAAKAGLARTAAHTEKHQ